MKNTFLIVASKRIVMNEISNIGNEALQSVLKDPHKNGRRF